MVALEIDIHDSVVVMRTVLLFVAEIDNQNLDIVYASKMRLELYSDDSVALLVVDNEVAVTVTVIDTYQFDDLPKRTAVDNASMFEVPYYFDYSIAVVAVALAELVVAPVVLIAFDTVVLERCFDDSTLDN